MNSIIPFKKNIIFKTQINEITDISLSHDYKVLDDIIEGEFYLSGTYKMTEASLIEEDFYYNIPFSIAISERIDKNTINLKLESFEYKINGDTLSLNVNLNMEAEEIKEEKENRNIIDDIKEGIEEKLGLNDNKDEEKKDDVKNEIEDNTIIEEKEANVNEVKTELNDNTIDGLLSTIDESKSYITYKVHIFREGDSVESISQKYNVSIEDIKEYNDINTINIGDKILVPYIYNE